jgi:uncharacterized membrane protein (DUF2068 family)
LATDQTFIQSLKDAGASQFVIDNIATIFLITAIVFFVFMIIYFALSYGFWGGRRWAWGLGLAFAVVNIIWMVLSFVALPGVSGLLSLVADMLIPLIILVYLVQPGVKRYFMEVPQQQFQPLPPMPPAP